MKGKKIIFLISALILPVAVFVFLKIFGRNEFNVPVIHQEGIIDAPPGCNFAYSTPYQIPDSISGRLGLNDSDSLYVIYFDPVVANAMRRVTVELHDQEIRIIPPAKLLLSGVDSAMLKKCIFLLPPDHSVVLVHANKIRGYYDGSDLDEMDRLIVELKIILEQY